MRFQALLDFFGDAQTAWEAPLDALLASGLNPKFAENLLDIRSQVSLDKVWEKLQARNIQVLTWDDEAYPRRLKEIDQPPPVLYVRGSIIPDDEWAVAIVGTRKATSYGRQVTQEIADNLARNGITIVSGLARGIDAIAHKAALDAGGRTLAVLGNGVDLIYPPEHKRLGEDIIAHGALLSDYPLETNPDARNFPPRNRIISGIALAVVIVEAGTTSGALITAAFAADQGRDVFAVPGSILSPQSQGTNRLIQDGARPLLSSQDIMEALNLTMATEHRSARAVIPTDATEARLIQILGHEPMHVDEIRLQMQLPIEKVTATLALMELKGMVRQVGGMHYVVLRENQGEYQV